MKLVHAEEQDKNIVNELYISVRNTPFCVWNEYYQTMEEIDNDNAYIDYYETELSDMVLNPSNYAYAFEMKFATLQKVCEFKTNRGAERDIWDVRLIDNKLNETKSLVNDLQCFWIRKRRQLRNIKTKIRDILQKNNIYIFTKLWHLLMGKGFR